MAKWSILPGEICEMVKKHECRESKTCKCYQLALEPRENCPVHGSGEWHPRCEVCGRFLKRHLSEEKIGESDVRCY